MYILVGTTQHCLSAARCPVLGRALLTSAGAGTPLYTLGRWDEGVKVTAQVG